MWKVVVVLAVAAAAGAAELPRLLRRSVKEAVVYGVMLTVGAVLSSAAMLLLNWPSPLNALAAIFEPVNKWISQLFR
ncbi:hypothetical protein [Paenibacillus sp. GYB003]|uniref:hypothetical protein n=1 Tax=Paenibacillus sp. GYB003 TaxID=2994392 RepID=UPI002F963CDB